MKKHAKQLFFSSMEVSLEQLNTNDKRGFWSIIRYFVKTYDCSANLPPLCNTTTDGHSIYLTTDQEKADCLNSYFASISTINDSNAVLPHLNIKTHSSLSAINVSELEVEDIIRTLVVNKASGPDFISHRMLKSVSKSVSGPLTILFNRSLSEGKFPDVWKVANVTPIFKKGDKTQPSNYRPVSLLSCCGKLFERVVFKHMYNFFMENNLLYKYQSGFLPNHSTNYQLIDMFHHICQSFDNKQFSCIVFCDISKAFDRVWHKGLLHKLKEHGINGQLLKWISNYLGNRQQRVILQSASSSIKPVTAGVPQGSVLGPLLFLIYVNDISDSLLSLTRLFADDSSLYYSASSLTDIEGIINHDLHVLSKWAETWLVDFNPNKTEAMLFSLKKTGNFTKLTFSEHFIELC